MARLSGRELELLKNLVRAGGGGLTALTFNAFTATVEECVIALAARSLSDLGR